MAGGVGSLSRTILRIALFSRDAWEREELDTPKNWTIFEKRAETKHSCKGDGLNSIVNDGLLITYGVCSRGEHVYSGLVTPLVFEGRTDHGNHSALAAVGDHGH